MSVEPGPNDILCGRGKRVASHEGNVQFRLFIDKYVREYHEAKSNASKGSVSLKVCAEVSKLNPPGRFLYKERGQYFVQTDVAEVDKKIKCAFRDRIKRENKKNLFSVIHNSFSKPLGNEKTNDKEIQNDSPNAFSNSSKSFESFLSTLSLLTISAGNLYPSSAKIDPGSLDNLFVSEMSIGTMDCGPSNNLSDTNNIENENKIFPRHRDMLEKRRGHEKGNIAMNTLPTSMLGIEDISPIMLPDDVDYSNINEMFGCTNMTHV